jgi:hypothetical protein
MNNETAQQIAEQWLAESKASSDKKDLQAHMGMISKRVSLEGVPGFETINYETWFSQCRYQFENAMIKSLDYKGINLVSAEEGQIIFTVYERVIGTDGTLNEQVVEMSLEIEDDDAWRLVKERVLIEGDAMRSHEVKQ